MPDVRVLPCTLALFGALGDLALRKLFPALYQLDRENLLHRDTRVLALARDEGAPAEHLATLEQRLRLAVPAKEWDDAVWQRFRERLDYLSMVRKMPRQTSPRVPTAWSGMRSQPSRSSRLRRTMAMNIAPT